MMAMNDISTNRNAAKTRVKDTTSRLQKGHFGRQRLDMLSKGLSATKPSEKPNSNQTTNSGIADITLAHAKHRRQSKEDANIATFVPSPVRVAPCTPRSARQRRRLEAHTSSSNASKSQVLEALDTSERQHALTESIYASRD
ncbi:hypothetical protein B0H34DRAFT_155043 [Crassisporium funariophilum]|nr:hypothetical protein B0H34DRAFT_155043 [Crassisporium funariophilum]